MRSPISLLIVLILFYVAKSQGLECYLCEDSIVLDHNNGNKEKGPCLEVDGSTPTTEKIPEEHGDKNGTGKTNGTTSSGICEFCVTTFIGDNNRTLSVIRTCVNGSGGAEDGLTETRARKSGIITVNHYCGSPKCNNPPAPIPIPPTTTHTSPKTTPQTTAETAGSTMTSETAQSTTEQSATSTTHGPVPGPQPGHGDPTKHVKCYECKGTLMHHGSREHCLKVDGSTDVISAVPYGRDSGGSLCTYCTRTFTNPPTDVFSRSCMASNQSLPLKCETRPLSGSGKDAVNVTVCLCQKDKCNHEELKAKVIASFAMGKVPYIEIMASFAFFLIGMRR